jgi:hypothetical protein
LDTIKEKRNFSKVKGKEVWTMIVRVYMLQVKPKTLASLQSIFGGSAEDSENLIVDIEEIKSNLSTLKRIREIKDIIDGIIKKKIEYVWFYL